MGVVITYKGSFSKTMRFMERCQRYGKLDRASLEYYGQKGVDALRLSTPKDTGETAELWRYKIVEEPGRVRIEWHNDNLTDSGPVAVLLQYGHGTKNGGWVEGRDYINPALKPIFDSIAENAWKEIKSG